MAADGGTPQHRTGALGAQPQLALVLEPRWHQEFPGDERELRQVRRWLATLLPECPARDDVASVATELATNAVRHTASGRGGKFAVEVCWRRGIVRVAVADCGAPNGPRVIDDPAGESGRGLLLVEGLSLRTGVLGDARGRVVWADVAWDSTPPSQPQEHGEVGQRRGGPAGCG